MTGQEIVTPTPWEGLRQFTQARIAIGRAGGSITTREMLKFNYDHARARDAVHIPLNINALTSDLQTFGQKVVAVSTRAGTRDIFLKRPDLGRTLSEGATQLLAKEGKDNTFDIAIMVADGLSSVAVERNAPTFLKKFIPDARALGFSMAPLTLIEQGRVASGDQTAKLLNAKIAAILIGERPGLSSPDSMGVYMTYNPTPGTTDEKRNCISNVRQEGFPPPAASDKLLYLVKESMRRQISGVDLKDMQTEHGPLPGPMG